MRALANIRNAGLFSCKYSSGDTHIYEAIMGQTCKGNDGASGRENELKSLCDTIIMIASNLRVIHVTHVSTAM